MTGVCAASNTRELIPLVSQPADRLQSYGHTHETTSQQSSYHRAATTAWLRLERENPAPTVMIWQWKSPVSDRSSLTDDWEVQTPLPGGIAPDG
jgi:hypothetical protein